MQVCVLKHKHGCLLLCHLICDPTLLIVCLLYGFWFCQWRKQVGSMLHAIRVYFLTFSSPLVSHARRHLYSLSLQSHFPVLNYYNLRNTEKKIRQFNQ